MNIQQARTLKPGDKINLITPEGLKPCTVFGIDEQGLSFIEDHKDNSNFVTGIIKLK